MGDNDDDDETHKDGGGKSSKSGGKSKKVSAAETAVRAEERRNARRDRPNKYVDPALRRKTGNNNVNNNTSTAGPQPQQKATSSIVHSVTKFGGGKTSSVASLATIAGTRTSLRKSTKAASARAAEERAKRRVDEEARRKQKALRDAEREPTRPLTQKERLEEAKQTEVMNRESLADLLRMEEEKKRAATTSKRETGPVISFLSRAGKSTVSLSEGVDVQKAMFPQMPELKKKGEVITTTADAGSNAQLSPSAATPLGKNK